MTVKSDRLAWTNEILEGLGWKQITSIGQDFVVNKQAAGETIKVNVLV